MEHAVAMDRQYLVGSLKGQKMHVPDFERIFKGWPAAFNPHLETLRHDVDERLKCIVESQYTRRSERALALKKLHAPNYALLGAYWWPFADEATLETMTFMVVWIALWDDVFEIDAPSLGCGTLADNWEEAQSYRYQTLLYIRQTLGLPCGSYQRRPDNICITTFEDIAFRVNANCTIEQKERFYSALEQHVLATAEKQRLRLSPGVPSVSSYLDTRMNSSGVRVCACLLDILQERELDAELRDDHNVQKLLDQINIMILVTNDMCSLKSKLNRGNVDNLVALLWLSHADLDSAVDVAASALEAAKNDFDATAAQLVDERSADGKPNADLEGLISACKAACTGNVVWSLSTRRYDLQLDDKDLRRTIVL